MSAKKTIAELRTSGSDTWRKMTKAQQAERIVEEQFSETGGPGYPRLPDRLPPLLPPKRGSTHMSSADWANFDLIRTYLVEHGLAHENDREMILARVKAHNLHDDALGQAIEQAWYAREVHEGMVENFKATQDGYAQREKDELSITLQLARLEDQRMGKQL